MTTMADDVIAVLDAAGIDRAFVVGISLGGMVAQHVALRYPSRVEGLVLLATSAGVPHAELPQLGAVATLLTLPIGGRLKPRHRIAPSLARLVLSTRDMFRSAELLASWPAALCLEPTSVGTYVAQLCAVVGHSTGARLPTIRCATVVMAGDDDPLIPPGNSARLAELVPGAHFEIVRECGHIIPASHPDSIRRALTRVRAMAAACAANETVKVTVVAEGGTVSSIVPPSRSNAA
jgi:pimeloyl-ACP methyl ester carboxylesterase